ncbi:MAG: bifunctional phosphopantothenoylcysteine decarboxylase/phosphopantothenate--cysteine ligase CoaBC [Tissierellia bacterium]|nr:bifunctional phosphopantothenoylcysteine decarboxylase/phosphopantothenate--cysteine ligase CoaBC [Tissierellia bacterium]
MLKGKNILLGVTGSIACYKAPEICSLLRKYGAEVKVIMTKAATEFITPLTMQTMSNHVVHDKMFEQVHNMDVEHISLAKWADVFVIAPATANIIGKFAHGIADDMLSTVYMASRCPVLIAPAMNTYMLESQGNKDNMKILEKRGVLILPTEEDLLACGDRGSGKMISPKKIVQAIDQALTTKDLKDKTFVITSGPTQEALDPVRYLTNHSSGKMGYALARNAKNRGAKVILISGPTSITPPEVDVLEKVTTTEEMFEAVGKYFDHCDCLIKAAAPADYRPASYSDEKIKKTGSEDLTEIPLERTPDIAKYYGQRKQGQIMVGFAAESTNIYDYAKGKLKSKNLDFIVVNNIKTKGAGFGTDTNIASLIDDNHVKDLEIMSKDQLAEKIIDHVVDLMS